MVVGGIGQGGVPVCSFELPFEDDACHPHVSVRVCRCCTFLFIRSFTMLVCLCMCVPILFVFACSCVRQGMLVCVH